MKEEEFIALGKIVKAHGFKGEWIVFVEFPNLSIFENLQSVFIDMRGNKVPFLIECFKRLHKKDKFLIKFKQESFLNPLIDLKNFELYIPYNLLKKEDKKKLTFKDELIGFSIRDSRGDFAKIKDIKRNSIQPLIIADYKEKEVFIPFVDAFIKKINKKKKYIIVDLPEGLLEIN